MLGEANTVGALAGRTPAGPVTFGRISTDDLTGTIRAYVGEGQFTDDPLDTFGTKAVVQVPRLPELMRSHLPQWLRASCGNDERALCCRGS